LQDVPQISVSDPAWNKSCSASTVKPLHLGGVDHHLGSCVRKDWRMEMPELRNQSQLALTKHSEDGSVVLPSSPSAVHPRRFLSASGDWCFLQINSHVPDCCSPIVVPAATGATASEISLQPSVINVQEVPFHSQRHSPRSTSSCSTGLQSVATTT